MILVPHMAIVDKEDRSTSRRCQSTSSFDSGSVDWPIFLLAIKRRSTIVDKTFSFVKNTNLKCGDLFWTKVVASRSQYRKTPRIRN